MTTKTNETVVDSLTWRRNALSQLANWHEAGGVFRGGEAHWAWRFPMPHTITVDLPKDVDWWDGSQALHGDLESIGLGYSTMQINVPGKLIVAGIHVL